MNPNIMSIPIFSFLPVLPLLLLLLLHVHSTLSAPSNPPSTSLRHALIPRVDDQPDLSADPPSNLDFNGNVARGIIRARVTYPTAELYEVTVTPRAGQPPARPQSLTRNLYLAMRAPPNATNPSGTWFTIRAGNLWGEWRDPSTPGVPSAGGLDPFDWASLELSVVEAADTLKGFSWDKAWTHVVVRKSQTRLEPDYDFWQLEHWRDRKYPVEVLCSANTGIVTPVYTRSELEEQEKVKEEQAAALEGGHWDVEGGVAVA